MSLPRPYAVLLFGVAVLVTGVPRVQATLNPETYQSPSGEYELRVDPSTIYGQGEGSYRMTRGGAEVWAKKLPFTLWNAAVTDQGVAAGYAYSLGRENRPMEPLGRDQPFDSVVGQLHLVIIDPEGGLRMNEILPRKGMDSCTTSIDRSVTGFVLDPDNDRFLVRTRESGELSLEETWRTYRLSTGKLADDFKITHPRASEHESWFLLSAQAVAGTPLILVNWDYSKYEPDQVRAQGGCFNLIDANGKAVWELDRPGDGPEYFENKDTGDERHNFDLHIYLQRHGATLRTDQPHRFDVWFVSAGKRVTFEVTPDGTPEKAWRVTEVDRTDYSGPDFSEPPPATVPRCELKHVGTIKLQVTGAAPPAIRDICRYAIDQRGRFGFARAEKAAPNTFVLVEPDGKVVAEIPLGEGSPCCGFNPVACIRNERWIVAADRPGKDDPVTGWWVDVDKQAVTPIESFKYRVGQVISLPDGRFVITDEQEYGDGRLVCLDENAKVLWTAGGLGHCSDLALTRDGRIAVLAGFDEITFFDRAGNCIGSLDLRPIQPTGAMSANGLTADAPDGLVVQFNYDSPHLWRIKADGTERGRFDPRHPDGRVVKLPGLFAADVKVAPDGRLWACDGQAFLRLTDEGVVDRVLGEPPGVPELREIGDVTLDAQGFLYVSDQRNCFIHVFDPEGKKVRIAEPKPEDFPQRYEWGPLTVAGDGTLYLRDVKFSADGQRLGKPGWPGDFVPGTQTTWLVEDEKVTLRDEHGQPVQTIARRPNGDWLNHIHAHAIAPDGTLALLTSAFDVEPRGDPSIHLYNPQGQPLRTLVPPNKVGFLGEQMAFNGRSLVVQLTDNLLVADLSTDPPEWSITNPQLPDPIWWRFSLAPGGKELWLFNLQQGSVERYELPGTSGGS